MNRAEAQFTALRYFALNSTGHPSHQEQASMIRRVHHLAQTITPTTNGYARPLTVVGLDYSIAPGQACRLSAVPLEAWTL